MAWPLADGHAGHALVLLEFLGGGYGAMVAAAWAMRKDGGLDVEGGLDCQSVLPCT